MRKRFHITGLCVPDKHYMVDLGSRLKKIRRLVDEGAYFVINRARQYGKTTILNALARYLADDYVIVRLDFQVLGSDSFRDENTFSLAFAECFLNALSIADESTTNIALNQCPAVQKLRDVQKEEASGFGLRRLFLLLQEFCRTADKPVVLTIDEIDSASNNQVFLDFLAQLRHYYLERDAVGVVTFQSVILAGVYDIKNLKRKIREDEDIRINSPWNIAAKFNVDLSFTEREIASMLEEYEKDYHTGMDIKLIAKLIYQDTSGYPFLVSEFCKLMDEEVMIAEDEERQIEKGNRLIDEKVRLTNEERKPIEEAGLMDKLAGSTVRAEKKAAWTKAGFLEAERMILSEKNTLFDSMIRKLRDYPQLDTMLKKLLFTGTELIYNADESALDTAEMFGLMKNQNGRAVISNRVFETRLYNYYLSAAEMQNTDPVAHKICLLK